MKSSKANRRRKERKLPQLPKLPRPSISPRLLKMPASIALVTLFAFGTREALDQPVRTLVVEGRLERVTATQIEAAIADQLHAGLFAIDLGAVRERVAGLDWVDEVWVARRWPDRLVVQVSEHRAAARWGDSGLLNTGGELFTNEARYPYPELPRLDGPQGSEQDTARYYLALRNRLIEAGLSLATLSLDERGALKFTLSSGQQVRVGREDIDERIERFFADVLPVVAGDLDRVRHIDIRYTNGFAISWHSAPAEETLLTMGPLGRG